MLSLKDAISKLDATRNGKLKVRLKENKEEVAYDPCIMAAFGKCDSVLVRTPAQTQEKYAIDLSLEGVVCMKYCDLLPVFSLCEVCRNHIFNRFSSYLETQHIWRQLFKQATTIDQLAYRYIVGLTLSNKMLVDESMDVKLKERAEIAGLTRLPKNLVINQVEIGNIRYHGSLIE
jgi:hypothetical protein